LGETGHDAHLLDAGQHKRRKQHIEELYGKEEDAKARTGSKSFRGERHAVVADEHDATVVPRSNAGF
jgi:hypothetical protein